MIPDKIRAAASGLERVIGRALLAAGSLLALLAGVAWALGGGVLRLGPLSLSVRRPFRSLAVAVAVLLVAESLRQAAGPRARLRFIALLAALFAALAADSQPRLVGDGQEYVAMAWNLAQGRPPGLSAPERTSLEKVFSLREGELGEGRQALVGRDGRQDFHHFWLYSLVVAPALVLVKAAGLSPLGAFTLTNALLLLLAAVLLHLRLGPGATLVLCGGPLIWWLDKPHAEIFLVALLSAALVSMGGRPERALPLVGLAAAQNPAFLPLLAVASAWAALRRGRRPFLLVGQALAWGLALANPLYYLHHLGTALPLGDTVLRHLPNPTELRAVLVDTNLGLLPAWPSLGLALAAAAVLALRTRVARWPWWELAAFAVAIGSLLVLFTQPGNINHGGTRGMSRYAVWLAPLALPALGRLAAAARPGWMALLAGLSLVSAVPEYLPERPERYLEPTPLAAWLWTRHPGLDTPLPEVFAERAWGYPPLGAVPASTPACEMALVRGDDTPIGRWPLSCVPAEKPPWCRPAGVLCYAFRRADGYGFARAPGQPTYRDRGLRRWYWSGTPATELTAAMKRLPWKDYGLVAPEDEGVFLAERRGVGKVQLRAAPGGFLAWFDGVKRDGAWLAPVVRSPGTWILIDPLSGAELSRAPLSPGAAPRIALPLRAPLLLVVMASGD
jgi:hypothetical protein